MFYDLLEGKCMRACRSRAQIRTRNHPKSYSIAIHWYTILPCNEGDNPPDNLKADVPREVPRERVPEADRDEDTGPNYEGSFSERALMDKDILFLETKCREKIRGW